MKMFVTSLAFTLAMLSGQAHAQTDPLFDTEDATQPAGAHAELDKLDAAGGDQAEPWHGPRVELGYEYFYLSDGRGSGATHALAFGGFFPVIPQFRVGLSLMGGSRDFSYEENDLFLGARAIAGYQHVGWDRVMPYIGGTLMGGVILGERFNSAIVDGLLGIGIEAGLDVRIVNSFYAGLGLGYTRADVDGLAHDLLILRLRVGL